MRVAYYKGCLASLSAKELDSSTKALAPKLGIELEELESVTCCGAGDIHEAEPDYYLHLNARILAYAEADGRGHADDDLQRLHAQPAAGELPAPERRCASRAGERQPRDGRRPALLGRRRGQAPPLADRRRRRLREAEGSRAQGSQGSQGRAVLRLPDPSAVEAPGLRGSRTGPWSLEAIIEACGGEAIDYPAKIKCCGFPIIQAREELALGELIQPIEQSLEAGADAMVTPCPLCHLSLDAWQQKLEASDRQELPDADPAPLAADRGGGRARRLGAQVQAPRRVGDPVLEKLEAP